MLEGEQLPGPAEAGLHLVDREQRAVAAAELLRAGEVAVRREVDAVTLDRLDEEERDVPAAELTLERVEIAERDLGEPRQQRPEALGEGRPAVRGQCPQSEPVEAVPRREHARAAGGRSSELERGLDGFGAGACEQDARESLRRPLEQLLREQAREQGHAELD